MKNQIGYLGIDVSKGYADFVLIDASKQMLEAPFQLDDNRQGHQALEGFLKKTFQQHPGLHSICCGVESTGGYENNWYRMLDQLGSKDKRIRISRINPRPIADSRNAEMQRTITDATSARAIAGYLVSFPQHVRYNESARAGNVGQIKPLYTHIQLLIKQQTQLKNQLDGLLYQGFPELLNLTKGRWPKWVWHFLSYYPTAAALAQAKGKLKNIPYANENKLSSLRKQVCQGSVFGADSPALRLSIQSLVSQVQYLEIHIKELKASLVKEVEAPEIDLLTSLPGVAQYSACGILIEMGDIGRFPDAEHLASFFGLHPTYKQSGDGAWAFRMSKKGSSAMRSILYMCAKNAVIWDEHFKTLYAKFRQKGFSYNKALGVIMHKMLRIIYGILSSGMPYDAKIDQHNRQKMNNVNPVSSSKDMTNFSSKKRRLQPLTTEAPVSKIHRKKRRLHLEPQNSIEKLSTRSSDEAG